MENNRKDQQEPQRQLDKNETLQNADTVADYGRSEQPQQNLDELEQRHGMNSGRQGNSSIPLDGDETIGNP
jgi:hypothetical protein